MQKKVTNSHLHKKIFSKQHLATLNHQALTEFLHHKKSMDIWTHTRTCCMVHHVAFRILLSEKRILYENPRRKKKIKKKSCRKICKMGVQCCIFAVLKKKSEKV